MVMFGIANGPLAWATYIFRNSLVFHDADKMTSVYIHVLPLFLTYGLVLMPAVGWVIFVFDTECWLNITCWMDNIINCTNSHGLAELGTDSQMLWLIVWSCGYIRPNGWMDQVAI